MSRVQVRGRRGLVLAAVVAMAAAALAGAVGYLAYEALRETSEADNNSNDADDDEEAESDRAAAPATAAAAAPAGRRQRRQAVVVSGRGVLVDSADGGDGWSGRVRVREQAAAVAARLAARYDVYVVVVVRRSGDEARVLAALEEAGIVGRQHHPVAGGDVVGESAVWVGGSSSSDDDEEEDASAASSRVSSILAAAAAESPGILPRSHVLFCETEEGKVHMARHLLRGAGAGYVDTNADVVGRLAAAAVRGTVLLAPRDAVIAGGEVPGVRTALSSSSAPAAAPAGETVEDIGESSLLA